MREGVVDEVGLSADFLAGEQLVTGAQVGGETAERGESSVGAARRQLLASLVQQAPDACRRMNVDAKVVHVLLAFGPRLSGVIAQLHWT